MTTTEWGAIHEPDPDELVDFLTNEEWGPVQVPVVTPHPVPVKTTDQV